MSLLEVKKLKTWYPVKQSLFQNKLWLKAVNDVSFSLKAGETVGLVGESGCGKSTLGRSIVRLEKPFGGEIIIDGEDIAALSSRKLRKSRTKFQMIFQDTYGSLNPRMSILQTLDEVLYIHTDMSKKERMKRAEDLINLVGLRKEQLLRYPHQFSGGQRQRIGIARALAVEPKLIVADEPVSALDVSVQAAIINLLMDIQKKTNVAFLFIAHDLAVVEHISHKILVMYLGKIVESGLAEEICQAPKHPYTQALISAVPSLDVRTKKRRIILEGDVPSPISPPAGCTFHPRCPFAKDICRSKTPELKSVENSDSHKIACHFTGL